MKSNIEKWEDFLYPMKGRKPSPPQDQYDVTTIEPISCMSRDLALKLQQKVSVDIGLKMSVKRKLLQTDYASESHTLKVPKAIFLQKPENVKVERDAGNNDEIIDQFDKVRSTRSQDTFVNPPTSRQSQESKNSPKGVFNIMSIDLAGDKYEKAETVTTLPKEKMHPFLPAMNLQQRRTSNQTMVSFFSPQLLEGYIDQASSTAQKDKPRKTSNKNHLSTSLSQWNFSMFTDYIIFDEYVHELNLSAHTTGADDWDLNVLFDDVLGMFGANKLKDCMLKENESRVLLDGILMKLSKKYNFLVQMELKSKLKYLPPGTFDYLITTTDGVPLGCVEAKSPAGMERKSFCQAVLELNLVQQLALKKGVDVIKAPVFCILSDGYRFILMQLKGTELFLEHTTLEPYGHMESGTHTTPKVIKIRTLNEPDDFKMLISSITKLITRSIPPAEGPAVKKDDDVILFEMPSN